MLKLSEDFKIEEIKEEPLTKRDRIAERPDVVKAKVYRFDSGFVKHKVYVTLSYIEQNKKKRPIEIFINSKDLTKNAEYTVLTRLISAIFRKSSNPAFILEELNGIHDPNGGYFNKGKYVLSFYSEIANVIEQFLGEIECVDAVEKEADAPKVKMSLSGNENLSLCPECNQRSVRMENGCMTCINEKCGYSKCDK